MQQTEDTLAETLDGTSTSVRRAFERGELIGRYVVLGRVGAGGMGIVYAAYDPELDRKIAVKLLHVDTVGHARSQAHRRLLREAQAMAKLSHPNVITVHDVGEHEGRVYLAMEFVEGTTLGRWIEQAPRRWPELLEVFLAAGRGLAAAHARGLVHRDFKPDNVMVGADGRVQVMDFGLARATVSPSDHEEAVVVVAADTNTPTEQLTRDGSILGTPAYMAPEQHLGLQVGPAADQFAFCVALWEALYGERPFTGKSMAELSVNVTGGRRREPPAGSRVPVWLQRACERGLAREPDQRFASMEALFEALHRGQRRARLTRTAGLVVAGLLVVGAIEGYRRYDEVRARLACEAEGAAIERAWNDDARLRLAEGLQGSGAGNAATIADKVGPWLDGYAHAWQQARTEVCMDGSVHETWDADVTARARWCLDERRTELEVLLERMARADLRTAGRAVQAAASLRAIAPCRDHDLLTRLPAPPVDARDEVQRVRTELSRALALQLTGAYEDGLEVAREGLQHAEALGWPPIVAAARLRVGNLLLRAGRYQEAETMQESAFFAAAESGATEEAFAAANELVLTVGDRQLRHDDAIRWSRLAEVMRLQLPDPAGLRQALQLHNLALIHQGKGEYPRARALLRRSHDLMQAALEPDHPKVAASLVNLATLDLIAGSYEDAIRGFERARAIQERALGPDHPQVATVLDNLAIARQSLGAFDEALDLHRRSQAILETALGPEHPDLAATLNNMALLHHMSGDYERARELGRRALVIREHALGPNHPEVADSLTNLAATHHDEGDLETARPLYERALAIREKALGTDHPDVAASLTNMGSVLLAAGELADAEAMQRRALEIWERTLGPEHVLLAHPLLGLAEVALAQGRAAEAIAPAERGVTLREAGRSPAVELAEARFTLARALRPSDPARATTLAEQAREGLRGTGRSSQRRLAEVEAWLSAPEDPSAAPP